MPDTKVATLQLTVRYNPELTDPDALCSALDQLLETSMSTTDILDEYGNPSVSEFSVVEFND